MLPCQRFLIFVSTNQFWDIIDVVAWRIRITIECSEFCLLWHLSYQSFQAYLFFTLQNSLLFLLLTLQIAFHVGDLVFDWVQLLVQLLVFTALHELPLPCWHPTPALCTQSHCFALWKNSFTLMGMLFVSWTHFGVLHLCLLLVRFREVFLRVGVGESAFGRVLCGQIRRIFAFSFEFFELFLCPAGKMLVLNESGLRVAINGRKSVSFNGACLTKPLLPPKLTSIAFHSNYYKPQEIDIYLCISCKKTPARKPWKNRKIS